MFAVLKKRHSHPPENQNNVIDIGDWEDSDSNDDGKHTGSPGSLFLSHKICSRRRYGN